jgi:SAM-dependent methyltransferase
MSTWHHGLVARWWAEFNHGGPEVEYFRPFVAAGQPALDAGCGTGRLLLPYLRDGLDVDGCDVSPDMLAECRRLAVAEGLEPTLYLQALHELDLPRRYRTIVVCGAFGLGSTREQDAEALRRLQEHLEPGGLLALDAEARWRFGGKQPGLAVPAEPPAERRSGADGAEYALRSRFVEVDQVGRRTELALHAWMWRDGELAAEEEHRLTESFYEQDELVALLERAGFADAEVRGGYHDGPPAAEDDMIVLLARRPA